MKAKNDMEKELIINGIKYVRYEEPKSYKIYDLTRAGLLEEGDDKYE